MSTVLDIPAVLLVGGMGTRLRSLFPETPKPLAPIGNISFLELLVRQLRHQGVRHLVMCTGYLADRMESKFGDGRAWDVTIEYSKESQPFGTAGAVKLAQRYLKDSSDFLVMNGDSFLEIAFSDLIRFHRAHGGLISMAVVRVKNASRYGTVQLDANNRVIRFAEKIDRDHAGLVNGGIYVFNSTIFDYLPDKPASLEKDVFPALLQQGVYASEQQGMFIDIGTPGDYMRARQLCDRLYRAALPKPALGSESQRLEIE